MKKLLFLIMVLFVAACSKNESNPVDAEDDNYRTITYQRSTQDIVNPESGFYRTASVRTSNFVPLDKNTLIGYRQGQFVPGTQYKVASSLLYRVYILDSFKDRPLSQEFLTNMSEDFEIAREAGVKIILRFSYINSTHSGDCPEGFICPPYGDAPLSVVLEHISQIKPVLQQNADVIATVQEGFIGIWGEGYYTDYFGDASSNGLGKYTDENWEDRNKVLQALLDALPKDRMVQVRTPQVKQKYIYGISAPITSPPLTEAQAFSESDRARIGFHNDAFLNDPLSQGYADRGTSDSPKDTSPQTIETLKSYVRDQSKFVVMGGESNAENPPKSLCGSEGKAEQALKNFHYDFLNAEYHTGVIESWVQGGCFDEIKRKLGYRFVLESAVLPVKVNKGDSFRIELEINNVGFSAPFNERPVQLILRNEETDKILSFTLDTNIRQWYPGEIRLEEIIKLPQNVATGTYEILLNMPDKYASIADRPEYSIKFANVNVWEDSTGYNKLNASVIIK